MSTQFVKDIVVMICLLALGVATALTIQSFWIAFLAIGLFQYHLVLLLHECIHFSFHPKKWVNQVIGKLTGALVFISFEAYQKEHWAHHRYTDTHQDPDRYIYDFKGPLNIKSILIWLFWRGLVEAKNKQVSKGLFAPKQISSSLRILFLQALIFLALRNLLNLDFTGALLAYLKYWALPLLLVAFFINRARINIEHGFGSLHPKGIDLVEIPLLLRWIIFPFSFNYHYSHHLNPHTPSYELEALSLATPTNRVTLDQYRKLLKKSRTGEL